jgi:hypothetical protein
MAWTLDVAEAARRRTYSVASLEQLRMHIEEAARVSAPELTLFDAGEPVLVLTFNEERAVLSARRPGTETFLVACVPTQTGPPVSFRLANGQVDEYPPRFIVPRDAALRALEHLMTTGDLAPRFEWSAE